MTGGSKTRKNALCSVVLTVARSILLASDKSLGVEKTPVCARSNLVDDIGFQVDVERTGHVLARGGFREESAETIIVRGRRVLNETTVGLKITLRHKQPAKRVVTHAETVLDGIELP
jgi:hypothetical protein